MAWNLKGEVTKCDHREYGFAQLEVRKFGTAGSSVDALFEGLGDEMQVMVPCRSIALFYQHSCAGVDVPWRPAIEDT